MRLPILLVDITVYIGKDRLSIYTELSQFLVGPRYLIEFY